MAAAPPWGSLSFQPQGRAAIRSFRHRHGHITGGRRNGDAPAEHCFGKRDRQFQSDVVAVAGEAAVGQDLYLDQSVAWAAAPRTRRPLALQAEDLTVDQAWRDLHVEGP